MVIVVGGGGSKKVAGKGDIHKALLGPVSQEKRHDGKRQGCGECPDGSAKFVVKRFLVAVVVGLIVIAVGFAHGCLIVCRFLEAFAETRYEYNDDDGENANKNNDRPTPRLDLDEVVFGEAFGEKWTFNGTEEVNDDNTCAEKSVY